MAERSPVHRLTELNFEVARIEAESQRLEAERRAASRAAARRVRRARYLRFLRWFRSPGKSLEIWPLLVLTVGPFLVAAPTMFFVDMIFDSRLDALGGFVLGAAVGAGLFAWLLYRPADALLLAAIPEAQSQAELAKARLAEAVDSCAAVNHLLKNLLDERRELVTSDKLQRAMLLQRNWKAMRDDEWEDYLAEVCRTLGARVERTGRSGDQGVDLIVEFGDRRIAVQAKGYFHSVSAAAVQQSVAGMAYYNCNACAAITNSRFTPGAKQLADCNRCKLIGEEEFPDFVMGRITI
jgi:restriction system protein